MSQQQMVYKWKSMPMESPPVDPQVAGNRLERIRAKNGGRLTAKMIVEDARPRRSPLHPAFEWNDIEAAQKYREQQAREMVRSIVIVVSAETEEEAAKSIRAYVSVRPQGEHTRSYVSIGDAFSDDHLRKQVLVRALKDLREWQRRYRDIKEFERLFLEIDSIELDEAA